jgi:erythromycin esterase-like protein
MRDYNSDPAHEVKLHFYGFDLPLGQGGLASPSGVLDIALDYLAAVDGGSALAQRERIGQLVGDAAEWERTAAMFDPAQSIGLSPSAAELRIATLDLSPSCRSGGRNWCLRVTRSATPRLCTMRSWPGGCWTLMPRSRRPVPTHGCWASVT